MDVFTLQEVSWFPFHSLPVPLTSKKRGKRVLCTYDQVRSMAQVYPLRVCDPVYRVLCTVGYLSCFRALGSFDCDARGARHARGGPTDVGGGAAH